MSDEEFVTCNASPTTIAKLLSVLMGKSVPL